MLRELLILLYICLAFSARRDLLGQGAIAAGTGPPGPDPGALLSLGFSARRQVVGNPGAIVAAIGARNARSRATDRYGFTSRGPPGLDPVDQARMQAQMDRERRERAQIYKANACSQTPCEDGTKVEFIQGVSRNEHQVQKGEIGTVMMYSDFSDMYTVKSDCQTLTLQVSAVMLQRSGSKRCPAADDEVSEVYDEIYDVGQEVMTTENKTKFQAGEEGVVRKIVGDGSAYKVCLDGQVVKTVAGVLTGGTTCQGGREELIAASLLKRI